MGRILDDAPAIESGVRPLGVVIFHIRMLANRAGAAQPNISQTIIKEMLIPKVPMILQEQFSAFVEQSDKSKHLLEICPFF